MGKNFRETLNTQLKNPEFKKEWDALEPEYLNTLKRLAEGLGMRLRLEFVPLAKEK